MVTAAAENSWTPQEGGGAPGQAGQVNGEGGILSHPRCRGRLLGSLGRMFPYITFQMTTYNPTEHSLLPLSSIWLWASELEWSSSLPQPQLSKGESIRKHPALGKAVRSSPSKHRAQRF